MSKNFEQLLEYVVNNETEKANALFHSIVVEKSREIYENLIADEAQAEAMGGDPTADLLDEISVEETDITTEADGEMSEEDESEEDEVEDMADEDESEEDESEDMGDEEAGLEDMEDRLVDLEDALKQLKADYDSKMADAGDEVESEEEHEAGESEEEEAAEHAPGGYEADETEEEEEEASEEGKPVMEFVEKAPKPVTSEPAGVNKVSPAAKNAKSPTDAGKPVQVKDGAEGKHGHGSASVPKPGKMTTAGNAAKLTKVSATSNKG